MMEWSLEMIIALNAKVNCSDGPCGRLNHIVLKSANEEITHLVIRDENADEKEYLVPLEMVSESAREQIELKCTRRELSALPTFNQEEYVPRSIFNPFKPYLVTPFAVLPGFYVPVEVEHIPAGELAIKKGANIEATDGPVGFVDEFLVNPEDNCLSHLILRQGHLWGRREVTIPTDQVDHFEDDTVYLKISKSEVESLPIVPINRFWIKKDHNVSAG
jgi:sporulation protein YlmC with PRC-barrel domain